jgi:hypothetical protein
MAVVESRNARVAAGDYRCVHALVFGEIAARVETTATATLTPHSQRRAILDVAKLHAV